MGRVDISLEVRWGDRLTPVLLGLAGLARIWQRRERSILINLTFIYKNRYHFLTLGW
jgi:hypothetical protein